MLRAARDRLVVCLVLVALVLGALTVVVLDAAPAAASNSATQPVVDSCAGVGRPSASFVAVDVAGRFAIDVDLDANSAATIESTRLVALFRAVQAGFDADSIAAIDAYLDSLIRWYVYLDAPCAPALPYPGPFTNVPDTPDAAYGFGGIDASVPSVVITISDPDTTSGDRVVPSSAGSGAVSVSDSVEDGPVLAHSGSESFVLAYFGAGLLAFGATALGMKRWMHAPS